MKNKSLLFCLIFFTILISGCSNISTNNVTISGRIEDYISGDGLVNVEVNIGSKTVYTNSEGEYIITGLPVNSYFEITASKDGYWPITDNIYTIENNTYNYYLYSKKDFSGSIAGRIEEIYGISNLNLSANKNLKLLAYKRNFNSSVSDSGYVQNEVLVKFKDRLSIQSNNLFGNVEAISNNGIYKIEAPDNVSTEELYEYYFGQENVEIVSYNYLVELATNDTYYSYQWNIESIDMPTAWNINTGSKGITVAVIDSGYVPHPDLNANIDTYNDKDYVDNDDDAIDDGAIYYSDSDFFPSHGTHVAGIIGAIGNNSNCITGVNWNINILPIRIFENNQTDTYKLIDAIYYAVQKGADVINLSLAYTTGNVFDPLMEEALEFADEAGVVVVAATGNFGETSDHSVRYPASSPITIAVGASRPNGQLAPYSCYGPELDIVAPGGDMGPYGQYVEDGIISTHHFINYTGYDYLFMEGTSMAAPHVSGIAALLMAQGMRDPDEIIYTITNQSYTDPILNPPTDFPTGVGLLNASKVLYANPNYDSTNPYHEVKVMATYKDEDTNTYYILSNEAATDNTGSYYIAYAMPDVELTVIGWIDSNYNNQIDDGDFFGEYSPPFILSDGLHENDINFNLYSVSSITSLATQNIDVVYSLPAELNPKGEE